MRLTAMLENVKDTFGHALGLAQAGETFNGVKFLSGFGSDKVQQISDSTEGNAYRAVYTVQFSDTVYVLDCFEKKSTDGLKTPQRIIDRIKMRLKAVKEQRKAKG